MSKDEYVSKKHQTSKDDLYTAAIKKKQIEEFYTIEKTLK